MDWKETAGSMAMHGKAIVSVIFLVANFSYPIEAIARIQRSAAEVLAFKRHNPCPSNGLRRGSCPGHQIDHIIALCAGGSDSVSNMQWITIDDHRFKTLIDVRECRRSKRQ